MRTRLRALLAALQPAELVLPDSGLDAATGKVLKAAAGSVRTNILAPGQGFWSADVAKKEMAKADYFAADAEGTMQDSRG